MTRDELTRKILSIKRAKSLSWKAIVAEIGGGSAVYLTAALMGQMKLRPEQAERAARLLELDEDEKRLLQEIPYRGSLPTAVPTDPLIYRFYDAPDQPARQKSFTIWEHRGCVERTET